MLSKADISPTSPTVSTPRTELKGLLLLARAITAILPGLNELPNRILLFGDLQCTISAIECDKKSVEVMFRNRVAEILDHFQSWRALGVVVDELHHWPLESNIADLPTRSKATFHDITTDSKWQQCPLITRQPQSLWPAS